MLISTKKYSLLLIDKDPFALAMFAQIFENAGFSVATRLRTDYDDVDIVETVCTLKPDVVITEVILPKRDGFEDIKILKNDPRTKKIPVIVLTNDFAETGSAWAQMLGASGYIIKANVHLPGIGDEIKRLLQTSKS